MSPRCDASHARRQNCQPLFTHEASISPPHTLTDTDTTICTHHLLPVDTLNVPQVPFYLSRHHRNQFNFSFFLLSRNSSDRLGGKKGTRLSQLLRFASVCSYLVKTLLFANDCLASLLIASCRRSFVISCRLWHFHKLTLCAFYSSRSNL